MEPTRSCKSGMANLIYKNRSKHPICNALWSYNRVTIKTLTHVAIGF